jgi:DNA-binding protein HU-beta
MSEKFNAEILTEVVTLYSSATTAEAREVVKKLFEAIKTIAGQGDVIRISDFGTFKTKVRAARKGRNPLTGASIDIAESRTLGFKPVKHSKK